jgi:tetratricopeptide (TPR) repeat protein
MKAIGLVAILSILSISLLGVGLLTLRSHRRTARFKEAVEAFERNDWEAARRGFEEVLLTDPDNEDAVVHLAKISGLRGDWPSEASYWQRAEQLNAEKPEYNRSLIRAQMQSRNFTGLFSALAWMESHGQSLDADLEAAYLYAALQTQRTSFLTQRLQKLSDRTSVVLQTALGRWLSVQLELEASSESDRIQKLRLFLDSEDPFVAFEAVVATAEFLTRNGLKDELPDWEALFQMGARANPFVGGPLLADYYFQTGKFNEAIALYEDHFQTRPSPSTAVILGDLYAVTGQRAKLEAMGKKFMTGHRLAMETGFYFDALNAFLDHDFSGLNAALGNVSGRLRTPMVMLMRMQAAVHAQATGEVEKIARAFFRMDRPFLDFEERVRMLAFDYLRSSAERDDHAAVAAMADLLRTPQDTDPWLTQIVIQDRMNRRTLTGSEVEAAVRQFPEDPLLLQAAAEYYLHNRQPLQSLGFADRCLKVGPMEQSGIDLIRSLALSQLGRFDEAAADFRTVLEKAPGNLALLERYLEFCVGQGRRSDLLDLAERLGAFEAEGYREFMPAIEAEVLMLDGKTVEALDLLERTNFENAELLFRSAYLLASHNRGDAAIARYQKLLPVFPLKGLILSNLAGIHAARGEHGEAMVYARQAFEVDPNAGVVRLAFARQLKEAGEYGRVLEVLNLPNYRAEVPKEAFEVWKDAIEELIRTSFRDGRVTQCIDYCRHLLIYEPESAVAREHMDKIDAATRNRGAGV